MTKNKNTDKQTKENNKQAQISDAEPFQLLGMTFASKKVLVDFVLTSLLVIVIPIGIVLFMQSYVQNDPTLTETMKTVYTVVPAVIFINIVMGFYVYKAIKDPQNYKKDPPLKIKPKRT